MEDRVTNGITTQKILDMWDVDSVIQEENLVAGAMGVAKLHAKYVRFYVDAKQQLAVKEQQLKTLRHYLSKYFKGTLNEEELSELGWKQYQGVHTNTEVADIVKADRLYLDKEKEFTYLKIMVDTLADILKAINTMSYDIKNTVEIKKFLAGV